jgi:hypothetical protein
MVPCHLSLGLQMIDAWGGWLLFQDLLDACKAVGDKHGASIPTVGVRFILDQVSPAGVRFIQDQVILVEDPKAG